MIEENNKDNSQVNNPLHGIRLIDILDFLVKEYGWEELKSIVLSVTLL